MSTLSKKERDELSLLLPWYANGTLSEEDSRRVEAALAGDDRLQREFDLVLEDQAAVVELVSEEEVPISIAARFNAALNAEGDAPVMSPERPATRESFLDRLAAAIFPDRPRAYAFAAVAVVLLLPALAVFTLMSANPQEPGQYQTASGEEEGAAERTRLIVKFGAEATWTDIDAFLKDNRGQIVSGPTADGLYELEFEPAEALATKIDAATGLFEFTLSAD